MRIDRFLANAGVGTRKEVHQILRDKRVTLNGVIVKSYSINIDPISDKIMIDDSIITLTEFHYLLLNKPIGYVCATTDKLSPPVTDLIGDYQKFGLFPVGRLDKDTTGALLLTNNGKLAHQLLSPKFEVKKTYLATVDKDIPHSLVAEFQKGILINNEYVTKPADLEILSPRQARVTIHEGKYHQVKRMFIAFGVKVIALERIRFVFLEVGDLALGAYRHLREDEVEQLIKIGKNAE